jgi:hypothetical protein
MDTSSKYENRELRSGQRDGDDGTVTSISTFDDQIRKDLGARGVATKVKAKMSPVWGGRKTPFQGEI